MNLICRFTEFMDHLCRTVAAQIGNIRRPATLPEAAIVLVWSRLRRIATRFAAIAAATGVSRSRPVRAPSPQPARPEFIAIETVMETRTAPRWPNRLRSGSGWLVRLARESAVHGSLLTHLLQDPEMRALVATAPQLRRVLRPLCRMLGVDIPADRPAPLPGIGPQREMRQEIRPRFRPAGGKSNGATRRKWLREGDFRGAWNGWCWYGLIVPD